MKKYVQTGLVALLIGQAQPGMADQVIVDDLIVDGRLCVGVACSNGEAFAGGVDLEIKSSTPRLYFEDMSVSTSVTTDWELRTSGDFIFRNVDDNVIPFRVNDDAVASTLVVASGNRIGIGTQFPAVELHVSDPTTPTFRLEQNTSLGLPQHIWDVAANNAVFAIRDSTNFRVPFAIYDNAPNNSLAILENGNVGMGEGIPNAPLHIERATGAATDMLRLENNEGVVFRLVDTAPGGQEWTFQSNNGLFRVASPAVPGPELTMDDFGNLTIRGEITTSGSCSVGCDRVFDAGYDLPEMADHHARMWELGHLPNVGPTAEEGPMNLSAKVGGILNELEHAHIFIDQQNRRIAELEDVIADLTSRMALLEAGD